MALIDRSGDLFSGMDNVKMLNRIENQRQADAISFRQAGQAPLKKTYSYNPKTVNKARAQAKQN